MNFAALMAPLGPFGAAPHLAVGVSGGPHSLALALLTRDWVLARGGRLLALVVDHGLRPGSDAEAASVAALLRGQNIPAKILPLGLPPGPRLHERARAARLSALLAACDAAGAPWLLLGHHRGDQAETVAFRALRGSGPDGLAGMAPVRATPEALILRPLLSIAPARLEAVCAAAGLAPIRDASNTDPRFARARLRQAMDPDGPMAAALSFIAAGYAHRRAATAAAVATRLAQSVAFRPEGWARLDRAALGQDATARAALSAALRTIAGAIHPPPAMGVAGLLARGHGTLAGAVLTPSGILAREPAAVVPEWRGTTWDGRWQCSGHAPGGGGWPPDLPAIVRAGLPGLSPAPLLFRPAGGPAQ
ncbi:tRNA lysidine(34) synthetase TilS [Humitalea sp. 24SJ18S-53]|uniref:tRNA lysidine(34) synthetase TilS n=1 Tax=Humitalea sp. 24SJ18S-53 TaxID=3422307 RepID=UPI003D66816F